MDEPEVTEALEPIDREARELLGLFDAPAFARRGRDLEHGLARLHGRCRQQRAAMLDMVHLRLRQWSALASGPDDWADAFGGPVAPLWTLAAAPAAAWADRPGPPRRRRSAARDLVASVERFNRRWARVLDAVDLDCLNALVDHYNRYYLLEKECVFRSARLAARHFDPAPRLTPEALAAEYPPLPVPILR